MQYSGQRLPKISLLIHNVMRLRGPEGGPTTRSATTVGSTRGRVGELGTQHSGQTSWHQSAPVRNGNTEKYPTGSYPLLGPCWVFLSISIQGREVRLASWTLSPTREVRLAGILDADPRDWLETWTLNNAAAKRPPKERGARHAMKPLLKIPSDFGRTHPLLFLKN